MPSDALARVLRGVQKSPEEPNMPENEKLVLSLEFLGTKRLLLEGPKGPADCIFTLFFASFLRSLKIVGPGSGRVTRCILGPGGGQQEGGTEPKRLRSTTPGSTKAKRHTNQ